ncbi:Protein of unknown function [Pyronema omphalodes CBS 100304]|uniref:Uncharacterized protein n=1 Tax=Pyronema omphalodes (strain CBS 100304) TaxID=1076935 RepID=U4LC47_PYROM|nr:Protein of unknown function [Pyronema omphalodes CBS 100304]
MGYPGAVTYELGSVCRIIAQLRGFGCNPHTLSLFGSTKADRDFLHYAECLHTQPCCSHSVRYSAQNILHLISSNVLESCRFTRLLRNVTFLHQSLNKVIYSSCETGTPTKLRTQTIRDVALCKERAKPAGMARPVSQLITKGPDFGLAPYTEKDKQPILESEPFGIPPLGNMWLCVDSSLVQVTQCC